MRIAIWLDIAEWGGVDDHVRTMLSKWDTGDQLVLFTNANDMILTRLVDVEIVGNRVVVVRLVNPLFRHTRLRRYLEIFFLPFFVQGCFYLAKRNLKRNGPFDALLIENGGYPGSWSSISVAKAADRLGIAHRAMIVCHKAEKPQTFRQTIEYYFDRKVQKWVTRFVCISQATRQSLFENRGFDSQKIQVSVVYCGVANEDCIGHTHNYLRDLLRLSDDRVLVGMLGRLSLYKGHSELLAAVSQLPLEIRSRIEVIFIGGSNAADVDRLEKIAELFGIADFVHFCGYVEQSPYCIISELDVLVSATQDFEGFGLTIGQAMSVGTAVIATDVGAVSELCDSNCAYLVKPGHLDLLTDSICLALTDESSTKMKIANAHMKILDFSPQKMSSEIRFNLFR
jgi:glycosyltransferase involved in cell wall biosynthesis